MRRHAATATPPPDWSQTPLGAVADVAFSNVDKKARPREAKVRLCNYLDVYQNDWVDDNHPYMEATATRTEIRKFGLRDGDILITKDSEAPDDIGIPTLVKNVGLDVVCGYHLALIRPRGGISPIFLAKQLRTERLQRYFGKEANGTTRYGLSTASVTGIPLWVPAESEQCRIAEILDTLDEAIRKTEQIIAKLQHMKQGLLHDLLTRGIDENGELRDPERHPEQFKDSPLGRIPKEWEVTHVGTCLESAIDGPFGSSLKTSHYVSSGVRIVRLQNIGVGQFDDTDKAFISERHARSLVRHEIRPGDLLVASLGDENHPIARACRYPDKLEPGIAKADCFRLRPLYGRAHAAFLMMALNCPETTRDVPGLSQGVTRDRINLGNLKRVRIALPQHAEQTQAFSLFSEADQRLSRENSSIAKLRILKHGLMDDLLTGRVRVSVPEEAAA